MATVPHQSGARQRRFSKSEYHLMADAGLFRGQRVELIEGRIMVLSPQHAPHWSGVERVRRRLEQVFGQGFQVRMQGPIDLGQASEPEPDIAVVAGAFEDFIEKHPTTAALIVEVSDSTVSYDRRRKGSLYARGNIADYWIVNLPRNRLEVYRNPIVDTTRRYGHRYSLRQDLHARDTVTPLALPGVGIAVADVLPGS